MSDLIEGSDATFGDFGKLFQEKIFQGLLSDHAWASQMVEVMRPDYFDVKYLKYLSNAHARVMQTIHI